jgi:hypothetical protein
MRCEQLHDHNDSHLGLGSCFLLALRTIFMHGCMVTQRNSNRVGVGNVHVRLGDDRLFRHRPPLTNQPLAPVSPSKSTASPLANGFQHDLMHRPHPEGPPRAMGRYAHASTSDERGGSLPAGFGKDGIGDGEGRLRADSLKAGAGVKGGECHGSLFFRSRFAYGRPHTHFFFA